ncbi:MAG: hypothetical protein KDD36_10500 [Flavobacteriales bacterium]|nr:hypothetical protein [Flavobacteriales bacterium]
MIFKRPGKADEALWICFFMLPFVATVGVKDESVAFGILVGFLAGLYGLGLFWFIRRKKKWWRWVSLAFSILLAVVVSESFDRIVTHYRHNRIIEKHYTMGELKSRVRLIDGKKEGEWISWHRNGHIAETGYYRNDIVRGWWRYYDDDGALEREGLYVNNERMGTWYSWYPDGTLRSRGHYMHDVLHGSWTYWHPNGVLAEYGLLVDGWEQGRWIQQDEQKKYITIKYYGNGRVRDKRERPQ